MATGERITEKIFIVPGTFYDFPFFIRSNVEWKFQCKASSTGGTLLCVRTYPSDADHHEFSQQGHEANRGTRLGWNPLFSFLVLFVCFLGMYLVDLVAISPNNATKKIGKWIYVFYVLNHSTYDDAILQSILVCMI